MSRLISSTEVDEKKKKAPKHLELISTQSYITRHQCFKNEEVAPWLTNIEMNQDFICPLWDRRPKKFAKNKDSRFFFIYKMAMPSHCTVYLSYIREIS